MYYILMHKGIPVAKLELDETVCVIRRIDEVYHPKHLPVGIPVRHGAVDRAALNEWWADRSIPASRSGVRQALETLQLSNPRMLITKCMGLSLSDQYWIRPFEREDIEWERVNFFTNAFTEDMGDLLFGRTEKQGPWNIHSPDNTSDGCLKKRWKLMSGRRCLVKGGSAPLMLQPFHEVIATMVCRRLGIPHAPYWLVWEDEVPYSVCEDFITADTEFVSAWRVMKTMKKDNSTSLYRHYLNCCQALGIQGMVHAMDQMLVLDYLIANEDRHLNNFGLIRNAGTLEWIGPAPVFDSGSSLGYDKLPAQIIAGKGMECKPFKRRHEEQVRLVTSFDWIDFEAIKGLDQDIREVFRDAGMYGDDSRIQAVVLSVNRRVAHLQELSREHGDIVDRPEDDVMENVAAAYIEE